MIEKTKVILNKHGIKPSVHRIKILEYLLEKRNHPTADTIYTDLSKAIPTLSKTTVYNTLKTFAESGVVLAITIEENEVRYDAFIDDHVHMKCIRCGEIYDIDLSNKLFSIKEIDGHTILQKHIYMKGICSNCKKQGKE